MMRTQWMVMAAVGVWLAATVNVAAQDRPLKELPADMWRWSMSWTKIPAGMVEAGRAHGPAAAVTIGPVQGAANLVGDTSTELWGLMKANKEHRRSAYAPRHSTGTALVRYEF